MRAADQLVAGGRGHVVADQDVVDTTAVVVTNNLKQKCLIELTIVEIR